MEQITFYDWLTKDYAGKVPAGGGLWCNMHIILMCLLAVWLIVLFFVFKKNKRFARIFTYVLCFVMIISRLIRMAIMLAVMKMPVLEVLPWQLCHILAFVFPICYFAKTKYINTPLLVFTFFGGILTFVFGNYYEYSAFSFLDAESIILHFSMPTVVLGSILGGVFKINLKEIWQIPVAAILLVAYASLGNVLVKDANFMYLKQNGLPFNLFAGQSHLLTYAVLAVILLALFYLPFVIISIKNKKAKKL